MTSGDRAEPGEQHGAGWHLTVASGAATRRPDAAGPSASTDLRMSPPHKPKAAKTELTLLGPVAQWAEQRTFNPTAEGSSPSRPTAI